MEGVDLMLPFVGKVGLERVITLMLVSLINHTFRMPFW